MTAWSGDFKRQATIRSRQFRYLPEDEPSPRRGATQFRGANIVDAGQHNRGLVLQTIRARGRVARPEIARLTGLSVPSVFKITKQLCDEGLTVADGRKNGQRGQPATELVINPDGAFALGLNVDRDHLSLVVIDFAGRVRAHFNDETAFSTPAEVRAFLRCHILDALASVSGDWSCISGIGVAIPDDLGDLTLPGQPDSYRQWRGYRAEQLLDGIIDLPVLQENDAAAAAIGEMVFGGGLAADSFFYVFVSAGLGGGLVVNRRYYRGARGRSGEIGFLPQFNPFRPRLTRLDKTLGDALLISRLYELLRASGVNASSPDDLDVPDLDTLPCVQSWIAEIADYLYPTLTTLMYAIDPNAIYVGGRLPAALSRSLCFELNRRLSLNLGDLWDEQIVRYSEVGSYAAAVGAAALMFDSVASAV